MLHGEMVKGSREPVGAQHEFVVRFFEDGGVVNVIAHGHPEVDRLIGETEFIVPFGPAEGFQGVDIIVVRFDNREDRGFGAINSKARYMGEGVD